MTELRSHQEVMEASVRRAWAAYRGETTEQRERQGRVAA
jgi:hypothetical protein